MLRTFAIVIFVALLVVWIVALSENPPTLPERGSPVDTPFPDNRKDIT